MNKKELCIENITDIHSKMTFYIMNSLLGIATKKMRAISLNYMDRVMDINIIFDSELTKEEEEEMMEADSDALSSAYPVLFDWQGKPILEVDKMNLNLIVIPSSVSILDKKGNIGWIYLRREY